jgi:hypothetical protein
MDPRGFLAIDDLKLEKECQIQPILYAEQARRLADLRRDYDEVSSTYDVVVAEMARKIRKSPKLYGLSDKPSEWSVKEAGLVQNEVKDAAKDVRDARHAMDVQQAMVTALEHRKRALTLMVELRTQDYYSEPRVSPGQRRAVQEGDKDRVRRLGQRRADHKEGEGEGE